MLIQLKQGQIVDMESLLDWMLTAKDGNYTIQKWRRFRTDDQNKYYWALLELVEDETGMDRDEIHEKMKMKFLFVHGSDKKLAYCRSTTKLNTQEMTDYIENVRNFMADTIGLVLPDADQFENFINKTNND